MNMFSNNPFYDTAIKTVSHLNGVLAAPAEWLKGYLALKTDLIVMPPLPFFVLFTFIMYTSMMYNGSWCSLLLGVLYPLSYGIVADYNAVVESTLYNYWMSYAALTVLESVMQYIPMYYYLKLALVYALVRDDFSFSSFVYKQLNNNIHSLYQSYTKTNID